MDTYQDLVEQKAELDARLAELNDFMRTEEFNELPSDERRRQARQWWIMTEFSSILGERIAAFPTQGGGQ